MNILYPIGILLLLIILGYPYLLLVVANSQEGAIRILGQAISGLFVVGLVLLIILYKAGLAKMPSFRFMGQRASPRMRRGMSGYVIGMMTEDEKVVDEFINALKANPELYEKFKEHLK